MRLFVGITPSAEAIAHATGVVDRIAPTTPDMRWVPGERWHVTLAFLGDVEPDRICGLAARLDAVAADQAPLHGLRLAGAGTFRGVLWLGVEPTERHSSADRLARAVQREVRCAGIPVESLQGYAGPTFDVQQVRLVQSITGPTPTYSDLAVVPLAGT